MPETKTSPSPRAQIEALQAAMLEDQLALLQEFAQFWDNVEVRKVKERLTELRARAVPNSAIDQQLGNFLMQLDSLANLPAHTRASIEAQIAQSKKPA